MSENIPEQPVETIVVESRPAEATLSDEFKEFGRNLSALLHVLRENPRAKEVETQVTQAMREMERQVNDAMGTARKRVQEQNLRDTLMGAAQTAVDETQRGLAKGLHVLNEQLSKTVQEADKARTTGPKGQVIEIETTPESPQASDTGNRPPYDSGL